MNELTRLNQHMLKLTQTINSIYAFIAFFSTQKSDTQDDTTPWDSRDSSDKQLFDI